MRAVALVALVACAVHPAHAAVWNITGWQRPYQKGNDLPTFTKARCGDTIHVACAPGVKAGVYRMSDPSGFCPPKFDSTTGMALSPPVADCKANLTISETDRGFFLTSQAPGDCRAGMRMGVKIPPCKQSVGYAVAPPKDLAAGPGKNATAALDQAVKTFNLSRVAAAANATAAAAAAASPAPAAAAPASGAAQASATAMLLAVVAAVGAVIVA